MFCLVSLTRRNLWIWFINSQALPTKSFLTFLSCHPHSVNMMISETEFRSGSIIYQIVSVQFSRVWLFATPRTAARQASLSITNSRTLLKLMSIKSVIPSNYLILCRPLLLPPSIFSSIRVFSKESVLCIKWPKDWSFSISPSNEYSGLTSFSIDWFDLLAVQGTLKRLLQHHSSKASILRRSTFLIK